MGSMAITFWAGCKKDDAAIFADAENAPSFKGKAMTITAAKAHYDKTQRALQGISFRSGEGDVDWENAVIDTAANGQVEVVAPVKGWHYAGTDGRKWAVNTKFEYDENGNPVGNYAIVTNDIGNTSDEWATCSGKVLYFGMDKKYQEGYRYSNGVTVPIYEVGDSTVPSNGRRMLVTFADGCTAICDMEVARPNAPNNPNNTNTKYNTGGTQETLMDCSEYICRGGSGGGGGGFVGNTDNTNAPDNNGSGGNSNTTSPNNSPSVLSTAETLMYNAFIASVGLPSWTNGLYIKSATACQNPAPTTPSGVNSALIKCQVKKQLNITNAAQLAFLEQNPGVVYQMWQSRESMEIFNYTAAQKQAILQNHLQLCMTNATYRASNSVGVSAIFCECLVLD